MKERLELTLTLEQKFQYYMQLAKNMNEISGELKDTSLTVLAGSIILLLGSDYVKPIQSKAKLMYLLFIPAWISLAISIYFSSEIATINACIISFKNLDDIKALIFEQGGIYAAYRYQSYSFLSGMLFLFIWLISYLLWWIYIENDNLKKYKKK